MAQISAKCGGVSQIGGNRLRRSAPDRRFKLVGGALPLLLRVVRRQINRLGLRLCGTNHKPWWLYAVIWWIKQVSHLV